MGPPDEEPIRRPIAPWANAITTELHLAPRFWRIVAECKQANLLLLCDSRQLAVCGPVEPSIIQAISRDLGPQITVICAGV